jgi:hypothetical protein
MDAEYNQWPMQGEAVANAGPFNMQHGSWRLEIEPTEQKMDDVFLHIMLPCDKDTLAGCQTALKEKIKLINSDDSINVEIEGKKRTYKLAFKRGSSDAHLTVIEAGKAILDHKLTVDTIKARAK